MKQIKISNFGNYGSTVVVAATLDDEKSFTIPAIVVSGVSFAGTGSISGTTVTLHYTTTDACDVVTCTATYTR